MSRPPNRGRCEPCSEEELLVDRGRPLGLRLLALLGALSFLMIGLSVVVPLLQPRPPLPGRSSERTS